MKRDAWRTGPPRKYPSPVTKLSGLLLIRQALIVLFMVIIWGGALALFVNATASPDLVIASGAQPTLAATIVPLPTKTDLPATATTVPATATSIATSTRPPTATAQRTATATRPVATATAAATSTPAISPSAVAAVTEPASTPSAGDAAVSFARDVQPIFNRVCVKCHGGEEVKEGLALKTHAEIMAGSDNGAVIAPGDPANSLLIDLITRGKMPKQGPKLLPGEVRLITDWVAAGAVNN
jgi:cytochrome c